MADNTPAPYQDIYAEIKETLLISRNQAYSAVNFAMVQAYWHIGRIIVEHEQNGSLRAEYGKAVLQGLSERLTEEFGKGLICVTASESHFSVRLAVMEPMNFPFSSRIGQQYDVRMSLEDCVPSL